MKEIGTLLQDMVVSINRWKVKPTALKVNKIDQDNEIDITLNLCFHSIFFIILGWKYT